VEVDEDRSTSVQRPGQRGPPQALGGAILVPYAADHWRVFAIGDDGVPQPTRGAGLDSRAMPSVEDVEAALTNVIDPELGLDFVELGLVYGIEVSAGDVHVTFTLTSPGCPIGPQVSEQIEEFVTELDGVTSVESTMTFSPPWTPDRMSEDAKFALGY
jgi:metal-sulfur cluster biosynthetic enzyme